MTVKAFSLREPVERRKPIRITTMPDYPLRVMEAPRYIIEIAENGRASITCRHCGHVSWNPKDVAEKYCAACHVFHEELPSPPGMFELPEETPG